MPSLVNIALHSSQFPKKVRRELLQCLQDRRISPKFHYDSYKQAGKWLELHQAYSPSRTDANCQALYDQSFEAAASRLKSGSVHLIGLGCGGGQKDARFLRVLQKRAMVQPGQISYTPCDVSVALVIEAQQVASDVAPISACHPLVCDLATADDLPEVLAEQNDPQANRLITFFGMIPNFEPGVILPRLASLVRAGDLLLFSANLAPGPDYAAGVLRVLPLYDNALTRDWLLTLLFDLGMEAGDGTVEFSIEDVAGLKRIVADLRFLRQCVLKAHDAFFEFQPDDKIRLFYSYRHTPSLVRGLLATHGLEVIGEWITESEEEGVFLVERRLHPEP